MGWRDVQLQYPPWQGSGAVRDVLVDAADHYGMNRAVILASAGRCDAVRSNATAEFIFVRSSLD